MNDSFPPIIDGVANAVINYAQNIDVSYGRAVVVTPSVPGADDSIFNFPVIRYPSIDTRKQMGYVTGYPFSLDIIRRVRQEHPEILHLHCPATSALLARQVKEILGLPLIMTYHTKYDIDIANLLRSKILQTGAIMALLQNIRACDEVWTVSHGAGENLRSLGFEGEYIVMPNGVDMPRGMADDAVVAEATGGYDLPEGVPVFLFVGRMMWYKGIHIILDALAAMKAAGEAFRMVFVGDGGDLGEIRQVTEELQLNDVCFFTGAISDREIIRAWYSRADLFLFPSSFDTNGLVVHEAAACSLPAVLIVGSCAAEDVTDGRNGFLIEENAEAMAAKLMELCAAPDRIQETGKRACSELYLSWEDAVAQATARYEIVLENNLRGVYKRKPTLQSNILRLQNDLIEKPRTAVWEFLDRYL